MNKSDLTTEELTVNNKLWIISEFYYPIVTSTGYYMTEIAEYMARQGKEVHVICTSSKYNEPQEYKTDFTDYHNGVHIHRIQLKNLDKNNFLKRTIRLLWTSILLWNKTFRVVRRGDTLLTVTNPVFLLLGLPLIKKLKHISYILLVHDIFPENLAAIGKIKKHSLLYKCLKFFFDKAYAKADICISIGRDMSEIIRRKISDPFRIRLIPNWAENREVFPLAKEETRMYRALGIQEKFIFQFAGNLGYAQGIDNILAAIRLVKNPHLHFTFIGGGAKYETIATFIKDHPEAPVSLIGFQDRSDQNDFLNACDVSLITLSDGMLGLGVPSKSYNIMAAGKPILIIADSRSEIALTVKEYTLGWVVEPHNPEALKEAFEKIYRQKDLLTNIQNNARTVAETLFAKENILARYGKILK